MMDNDNTPRDPMDLALDVVRDLEFIRSNPSPEVIQHYVREQLLAAARRTAWRSIRRHRESDTVVIRHIDWP